MLKKYEAEKKLRKYRLYNEKDSKIYFNLWYI